MDDETSTPVDDLVGGLPVAGTVTVRHPMFDENTDIEVPGLGSLKNGSTKNVNEVQIAMFRNAGHEWPEDNNLVIEFAEEAPNDVTQEEYLEGYAQGADEDNQDADEEDPEQDGS